MFSRTKKVAAILSVTTLAAIGGGTAWAHVARAASTDTDDSLSNKGAAVTANNSGTLIITVNSPAGTLIATCTGVVAKFTVPNTGLKANITSIAINNCTDQFSGNVTITINNTPGIWKVQFKDTVNETEGSPDSTEPNKGDKFLVNIGNNAATFQDTTLPGCTLTLNATGQPASKLKGNYNDAITGTGIATFAAGQSPGTVNPGSGCPSGNYSETLNQFKFILDTPVHDLS